MIDYSQLVTVYCQGNGAARNQAAKYAGPKGLVVKVCDKEERVFIADAPLLLHNLYVWPELRDIGYGFSLNPLHLVSKFKSWVTNWYFGIQGASLAHNHLTELNVAGDDDVAQYVAAVRQCIHDNPDKKVVLFGTSRGAATVLVSLTHFTKEEQDHIKLVVAEGPFDTVPNVVDYRFGILGPLLLWTMERFGRYRPTQRSPLEAVEHSDFPLDLPLAIVFSRIDTIVPADSTRILIRTLEDRGHGKLQTLALKNSHHSMMPIGPDRMVYINFFIALYWDVLRK